MSISSPFLCRVGGRAGEDEVDAKTLFGADQAGAGAVLCADEVGVVLGAVEVDADIDADEVVADLGAEDVGANLSALKVPLKKLLTAFLFPFHTSISCSYASSSL